MDFLARLSEQQDPLLVQEKTKTNSQFSMENYHKVVLDCLLPEVIIRVTMSLQVKAYSFHKHFDLYESMTAPHNLLIDLIEEVRVPREVQVHYKLLES